MKKGKEKLKAIIIIIVLIAITAFLAWKIIEKNMRPEIIYTETPNSMKHEEAVNNVVLENDKIDIKENEVVQKENSSLYSYTNETYEAKDNDEQKALKLAKKYWSGSEDDNSAMYVVMDKKSNIYSITLYDKVTTYAFLWLEVNVKDGTVTEVPEQYIEQK